MKPNPVFFREDLLQLSEENDILWTRIHRGFHEMVQLTRWCADHEIITAEHIEFIRSIINEKLEQVGRKKYNRETKRD